MITTAAACGDGALAIRGEVDEVGAVARVATRACARVAAVGLVAGDVDVVIHDDAFAFAAATGEDRHPAGLVALWADRSDDAGVVAAP